MIDKCIATIYKRDERVIIPDFGAVIYSDYSDEHDFNNLLNFDDGKVVAEIQKQQSIPEEEASAALEEYVKDISDKIEQGKSVLIKGIGYFLKNEQGTIIIQKTKPDYKSKNTLKVADEPEDKVEEPEVGKEEIKEDISSPFDELVKDNIPDVEEPQDEGEVGLDHPDEELISEGEIDEEVVEEEIVSQVQEEEIIEEELTTPITTEEKEEAITAQVPDEDKEEIIEEEKDKYDLLLGDVDEGHYGNTFIHGEELSMEEDDLENPDEPEADEEYRSARKFAWEEEPKNNNTLKVVLLVLLPLLLIGTGAFYYFNYYKDGGAEGKIVKQQPKKEVPPPLTSETNDLPKKEPAQDNNKIITTEKPAIEETKQELIKQSPTVSNTKPKTVENNPSVNNSAADGNKSYSLILGSFKVESNADNYQKHLQSQGMNVVKFQGRYNYYFVGIDNIGNKTEATRQLELVQQENPSAWIINKALIRL